MRDRIDLRDLAIRAFWTVVEGAGALVAPWLLLQADPSVHPIWLAAAYAGAAAGLTFVLRAIRQFLGKD